MKNVVVTIVVDEGGSMTIEVKPDIPIKNLRHLLTAALELAKQAT